jgi:hypothetical protein
MILRMAVPSLNRARCGCAVARTFVAATITSYADAEQQEEIQMPAAFFVVRAIVTETGKRAAFDKWYETEHMPDAVRAFGVSKAWRFWSLDDPSLHQAMYRFDDEARLAATLNGDALKRLVADFNRDWPDVKRSRETLALAQEFAK